MQGTALPVSALTSSRTKVTSARNRRRIMSKNSRTTSRRIAWVAVMTLIGIFLLQGANEDARAQFRLPHGPNLPNIPNIINNGNSGSRQGNPNDLRNLMDLGKKFGEICDIDNPQRQQDLGQSIALAISNKYPVSKDRSLNEYVNLVGLTM